MPLIDTHAHLHEPTFVHEIPEVVKRAEERGLEAILTVGTDLASSNFAIELAEQNPLIHAAVGIHPNYVSQAHPDDWARIRELALNPCVLAIGETGLDRYWDYAPFEIQQEYFTRHMELSRETGKPFIVHCRDAEADIKAMLQNVEGELNGVMHSFCGTAEMADYCVGRGMYLSLSGMITYKKNAELRELASRLPEDRLLLETDCPYLAPTPHRGKRNEPAFVWHTAEILAELKGVIPQKIGDQTTANAKRWLGLTF